MSFSKTLKNITLLSVLLIILGGIKATIYYNHFNINILDYLNPQEVIFLFSDDLLFLFVICIFGYVNNVLITSTKDSKKQKIMYRALPRLKFKKRLFLYIKIYRLISFSLYIVFITSLFLLGKYLDIEFWKGLKSESTQDFLLMILLLVLYVCFLPFWDEFQLKLLHVYSQRYHDDVKRGVPILLGSIFIMYTFAKYDISKTENERVDKGTSIILNNESVLTSDETFYYLGKSSDFVYWFDSKEKTGKVIPSERVRKYILK